MSPLCNPTLCFLRDGKWLFSRDSMSCIVSRYITGMAGNRVIVGKWHHRRKTEKCIYKRGTMWVIWESFSDRFQLKCSWYHEYLNVEGWWFLKHTQKCIIFYFSVMFYVTLRAQQQLYLLDQRELVPCFVKVTSHRPLAVSAMNLSVTFALFLLLLNLHTFTAMVSKATSDLSYQIHVVEYSICLQNAVE